MENWDVKRSLLNYKVHTNDEKRHDVKVKSFSLQMADVIFMSRSCWCEVESLNVLRSGLSLVNLCDHDFDHFLSSTTFHFACLLSMNFAVSFETHFMFVREHGQSFFLLHFCSVSCFFDTLTSIFGHRNFATLFDYLNRRGVGASLREILCWHEFRFSLFVCGVIVPVEGGLFRIKRASDIFLRFLFDSYTYKAFKWCLLPDHFKWSVVSCENPQIVLFYVRWNSNPRRPAGFFLKLVPLLSFPHFLAKLLLGLQHESHPVAK